MVTGSNTKKPRPIGIAARILNPNQTAPNKSSGSGFLRKASGLPFNAVAVLTPANMIKGQAYKSAMDSTAIRIAKRIIPIHIQGIKVNSCQRLINQDQTLLISTVFASTVASLG